MTKLNRPEWKLYRHCYECGVAARAACRDDMDRVTEAPCQGRRLYTQEPERIADDVVAAPAKVYRPSPVVRTTVRAPQPVVIAGSIMAFDDVAVSPTLPVRCLEDELNPWRPVTKSAPARCCSFCRDALPFVDGKERACEKADCIRRRAKRAVQQKQQRAAARGVAA